MKEIKFQCYKELMSSTVNPLSGKEEDKVYQEQMGALSQQVNSSAGNLCKNVTKATETRSGSAGNSHFIE